MSPTARGAADAADPSEPLVRPGALQIAAALVGVQGVVLLAWGVGELVRSIFGHPHDKGTAVLLGVVVLFYAIAVLAAARGLWLVRRWAQTPAFMVSFFALVVGFGQLHTLPALMVPLIGIGIGSFVALASPSCRHALGGI
jgi:hypothetical protein